MDTESTLTDGPLGGQDANTAAGPEVSPCRYPTVFQRPVVKNIPRRLDFRLPCQIQGDTGVTKKIVGRTTPVYFVTQGPHLFRRGFRSQ